MLLKSLEIYGFKSFAERTKIEFDKGITGIVGPNGSGKSNVLDAIRWALGEQSAKSLRGGKMEDIIFAGTQDRKSLGFAEVSLTLDNTSGGLPIDFSEVTITRRLYRSGESEYYINKTQCRLRDVSELFMDTGVGKEGYSIIGQGRIDQILSSNTQERRHVLEEAAGIVKYKTRREEAERKLERTEENLIRVDDIISEISRQIGPLRRERDKAKEYLQLRDDLRLYELNDFVINYRKLSQRAEKDREQMELLSTEITKERELLLENGHERDRLKTTMDELNNQISNYNSQRHDIEYKIKALEGHIGIDNERINQARNDIVRLEDELVDEKAELVSKEDEISQIDVEITDKDNERQILMSKEKTNLEKLVAIERELDRYREDMSSFKFDIDSKRDELSKTREQIVYMETKLQGLKEEIEQIHREIALELEKLQEANLELTKNREKRDELVSCIDIIGQKKAAEETKIKELKESLERLDSQITRLTKDLGNNRARLTLLNKMDLNHEGYYRSVKQILNAIDRGTLKADGIHGVVAQLMEVPEELEKAIEMALGSSMQFIVTQSEKDAKIGIDYLRANRFGRATFLPMTTIRGRGLSKGEQNCLEMPGVLGIGSQLIDFHHRYIDIFNYLLGRVLIVEDMDNGIEIAKKFRHAFKIVTLEGDVINIGGSMSGGSSPDRDVSILSRRREIEELKESVEDSEERLKELNISRESLMGDLDTSLDMVKQFDISLSRENTALAVLDEKIQGLDKSIENLQRERANRVTRSEELDRKKSDIEREHDSKLQLFNEIEQEIVGIDGQLEGWEIGERQIFGHREEIDRDITEIKIQLASVEQRIISRRESRSSLEEAIHRHKKNIQEKQRRIYTNESLCEELEKKNMESNRKIEEYKTETIDIDRALEKCLEDRKDKEVSIEKLYVEYRDLEERISDIVEKRHQVDIRISRLEVEIDNIQDNIWDDYSISYSGALEYYDETLSPAHINSQITKLKQRVRSLGDVNVGAIEQYRELSTRHEFLENQKFDLEMAMDDLKEVIVDITKTMEKQFKEEVEIISIHFNQMFQELFGGGTAKLILSDESRALDSEIEIEAQPPGKRLQNISLLSGGEKALTAIALLFGILRRKPCPFCVLDEIDAPLDEGNLDNFCNVLNGFIEDTQFVIITHRKITMGASDVLYGITMEEKGISRMVSVRFDDVAS